jgi:hypothetical protein
MKPPTPTSTQGAILRAIVEIPGQTAADLCRAISPPCPTFDRPVTGPDDYRARVAAREKWRAECASRSRRTTNALRKLTAAGWLLPADAGRLAPLGRRSVARWPSDPLYCVERATRLAVACDEAPPEAWHWDRERIAAILSALAFRPTGLKDTANRLGHDRPRGDFRRAWTQGETIGLWWRPSSRLPSPAAVAALGGPEAREVTRARL